MQTIFRRRRLGGAYLARSVRGVLIAMTLTACSSSDAPRRESARGDGRQSSGVSLTDSTATDSASGVATAPIGALATSGVNVDSAVASMLACPRDGNWHVCSLEQRFSQAGLRVLAIDSAVEIPGMSAPTRAWQIGGQRLRVAFFASEGEARQAMAGMDSARAVPAGSTSSPWLGRATLLHNANVVAVLIGGTERAIERASNALLAGPPQPAPK